MAKIFKNSKDADVKQLDFFATPPTNTSMVDRRYLQFNPVNGITKNTSVLHFSIKPHSLRYLDLKNTLLWVKTKIRDAEGNVPAADDIVFPVNHPLRSMWKQVEVYVGGKLVTTGTANYHFKSMIKTMVHQMKDYGSKSRLMTEIFSEDSPDAHDSLNGDPNNNGQLFRQGLFGGGETVEMEGKLNEDIFDIEKMLLNGVELDVKLYVNRDACSLMSNKSNKEFHLEIEDALLKVATVEVGGELIEAHSEGMKKGGKAVYFFTQAVLNNFTVAAGQNHFSQAIFQGKIPQRVIVAMVDSDRYAGRYDLNPFKFDHFNVRNMCMLVNDVCTPHRPMEMDFRKRQFSTALYSILRVAPNVLINHENFDKGFALFAFDINSSVNPHELPLQRGGTVRLEMQFATPLPNAIQVLAYGEYQQCIEIDESRSVVYNPL